MICTTCKREEATVHLTEIRGGAASLSHYLCANCARERGLDEEIAPPVEREPPEGAPPL